MSKRTKRTNKNQVNKVPRGSLFVTSQEVADAFGYTAKTARILMEKGELPGRKVGGEWRMHKDDFALITRPQLPTAPVTVGTEQEVAAA